MLLLHLTSHFVPFKWREANVLDIFLASSCSQQSRDAGAIFGNKLLIFLASWAIYVNSKWSKDEATNICIYSSLKCILICIFPHPCLSGVACGTLLVCLLLVWGKPWGMGPAGKHRLLSWCWPLTDLVKDSTVSLHSQWNLFYQFVLTPILNFSCSLIAFKTWEPCSTLTSLHHSDQKRWQWNLEFHKKILDKLHEQYKLYCHWIKRFSTDLH